jgi:anti-sigma factor RsiW
MDCSAAVDLIHARLDGELSPAEVRALTEHLDACGQCRREDEQMRAVVTLESERPLDDPGPEFARLVMARVGNESRPVAFWPPTLFLAAFTAILLSVNHLWLTGFRLGDAAEAAEAAQTWVLGALQGLWQGLNSLLALMTATAAEQSGYWQAGLRPYLPALAGVAVLLLILSRLPLPKPAAAAQRSE